MWKILTICLLAAASAMAQISPMHSFSLQDEELDDYKVSGSVRMNHCLAQGFTKINGTLSAQNRCLFEDLAVNGDCSLKQCVVKGGLYARGILVLDYTLVQEDIIAPAREINLLQTRVSGDITVKKVNNFPGKQIVHIRRGSSVDGNITFDSKNGEVHLYKGSKFLGATVGGKIIRFAQEE